MSEPPEHGQRPDRVTTDLVEYFIVGLPTLDSLGALAPALVELVDRAAIRILDLVMLEKSADGGVSALELEAVEGMEALGDLRSGFGRMLSDRDIQLAAMALRPGTAGVVVVTEDRWAEPLSVAAQRAGGQIIAGDRIPASRVESALADRSDDEGEGG